MKSKERGKNPTSSDKKDKMDRQPMPRQPDQEQREHRPAQQPGHGPEHRQPQQPGQGSEHRQPQQPGQGSEHQQPQQGHGMPEHRQPPQADPEQRRQFDRDPQGRMPDPLDRRPGSPRERSDEDVIGRPVQLDKGQQMPDDVDEPDPAIKGGQRSDR